MGLSTAYKSVFNCLFRFSFLKMCSLKRRLRPGNPTCSSTLSSSSSSSLVTLTPSETASPLSLHRSCLNAGIKMTRAHHTCSSLRDEYSLPSQLLAPRARLHTKCSFWGGGGGRGGGGKAHTRTQQTNKMTGEWREG